MVEALLVLITHITKKKKKRNHKKPTNKNTTSYQKQEWMLYISDDKLDSSGPVSAKLGLADLFVFSGPV